MENRDSISIELTAAVRAQLADTPIGVVQFGLADCQPPAVIVQAQENAKEREIAIQKAEANKQVALKEAEANYEVAIKQQQVDLKEAETQVLVERKLSEGVNKAFVAQRALRVLEKLADSDNKVFFLPQETFSNPALILGAVQESFKDNDPAPAPYVPVSKK
jgi:F0F1-type ATP synthase epsilon subunit